MKFLLTIIQAVGLGCASAAAGRRVLHYLQLESYQLPGYVKSVRRNAMRALIPPIAMAAVGVAALRLSGLTGLALLLEALTAALLVWQAAKEKAKKPFVATERVKRLLAVHAAVNTVLALALLTVSPVLGYLMPAFEPALLMLEACDLAAEGGPAAEIAKRMETERDHVYASFIIDTLEFLWKGGRCSGVAALGANLLRLKPCIEVRDGNMHVGRKFRGRLGDVLEQYAAAKLSGREGLRLNRVFITHSGVEDGMVERVKGVVKSLAPFEEVFVTRAGCTVSSHCGPGTLGVLFMAD